MKFKFFSFKNVPLVLTVYNYMKQWELAWDSFCIVSVVHDVKVNEKLKVCLLFTSYYTCYLCHRRLSKWKNNQESKL